MSETKDEENKRGLADAEEMFNNMYPVGKERWIKVKYLDRDKAMENIRLSSWNNEKAEELGFEVTAICCFDDYNSQVSAMMEVRGEMQGILYNMSYQNPSPEDMIIVLDNMLVNKIQQLKRDTIVYSEDKKEIMLSNQLILDEYEEGKYKVKVGDSILEECGEDREGALSFIYERSTNELK